MSITNIISLFGGVALFLFGMSVMTEGLEKMSGGRLESILERLTSNIFKGVLLGALVTGLIQSSAATTVMVVGFVNSGIMRLSQAVGIIMGANIGTTVTAQLLRLGDISSDNILLQLLKPSVFGPILSLVGVVLYMFINNGRGKIVGQIMAGLGILFFGMTTMEVAVGPLKDIPAVQQLFVKFSNPFLGILLGAAVTALIQSSSASVGILQALSSTGLIRFSTAMPIIFGQNIGTCITALLSSIGASPNAKRAAMIHLYFNIIGTLFFLILLYALQYTISLPMWDDIMTRGSIANLHLAFNVATTVLLLPFNKLLVKLAEITIRDKTDQAHIEITVLDERFLTAPSLALDKTNDVVIQMGKYAQSNYELSRQILRQYDEKKVELQRETENALDKMESLIDNYLVKLTNRTLANAESVRVSEYLHITGDFERIGDYADNLVEIAAFLHERGLEFSTRAKMELQAMCDAVGEIIDKTVYCYENRDYNAALDIEPLEQVIDLMKEVLRAKHIERLKNNECTIELGSQYLELIINLERISDHCSNIAVNLIHQHNSPDGTDSFDAHEYLRTMHEGNTEEYSHSFYAYKEKYLSQISM